MDYNSIKISTEQAEKILFELYDIKGKAAALPGYVDFNFRIKVKNKEGFILKISRPEENKKYVEFQQNLLQTIEASDENLIAPKVVTDINGNSISEIKDDFGKNRLVRLLTWVSGRVWSAVNPQLEDFRFSLGEQCGILTKALQSFDHPEAHYTFEWDIAQSLWTKEQLHLFTAEKKEILSYHQDQFENSQASYLKLRKSVVHNDPNDNNIIVSDDVINPKAIAAIDYGDAMYTQTINDVAILCAYGVMRHKDSLNASLALVKGYHSTFPLEELELEHLYNAIAMRLVIIVTRAAMSKIEEPDNEYLWLSEKPAWEVLMKWKEIAPDFAHYSFREACGFTAHPQQEQFHDWASKNKFNISELFPSIDRNEVHHLDLSVSSKWIGHQESFNDLDAFQFKIEQLQKKHPQKIIAGGYLEPRVLYTSSAYDKIGNYGSESRTIHLGVDFWLPENTAVHALFDGEVVCAVNDAGNKEYGGLLILKHETVELEFYTLYGHNTVASVLKHRIGDVVKKGTQITGLANYPENGDWAPHLHFQVMLSMLDYKIDYPGVAYHRQMNVWKSICPDPNLLFKSDELAKQNTPTNNDLIDYRKQHLGKSLSMQYNTPIKMVRGSGQYLLDQFGRKYLDTVNNVAHVGHENYQVVKAGQDQMALINTNSRYLHENINELAKELMETLPPELNVLHFVNSGSEANELAIRMVKAVIGEKDIIASEVGYHGNTNMCVDISSYKFDGKSGNGAPEHTHLFPLPDSYRGKYRGQNIASKYVEEVQICIENIQHKGRNVGALIIEPIISCGGQIELPEGFLTEAYQMVRNAGGLCISDEIQVGIGRLGKTFWGFQLHDVVPDIVTIGKPLGNGHPIAGVVCTQEVVDKFANGMEYFNTFGGNPVSCAIATEVLRTVKREKLQEHALEVGEFLKTELHQLSKEFSIIGDVRGQGLFLGIELVDSKMNPLAKQTDYLVNRMKDHGILMSIDGPDNNVLKIKPPMVFTKENATALLYYLRKIFAEDFMKTYN
ncbi:MAG: aminotransferase class III-fold pyridoxal phosphate-dependent enzyme [Flavobacteriaceae bacterium]|nr:aminotransferase class III-fold pyridoxal phosphate-dependent enzyme [Flavobacteriaceae bacterium]